MGDGSQSPILQGFHSHLLFYFALQCNYLYGKICSNIYMVNHIEMTAETAFLVLYITQKV